MPRHHHKLLVWQKAISLVKLVYQISSKFPNAENYGLTAQMRRAAISVPANIAEGVGRIGSRDRIQFFAIARGSLAELETFAVLANQLGYCADTKEIESALEEVMALLNGLINAERRKVPAK